MKEILKRYGDETVQIIRDNLSRTGTNATGQTSDTLETVMIADNHVRVTGRAYIFSVETGRRPGGMPPVDKIDEWIKAKGVDLNAWAIAKTMAKEGSKLFRDGGRKDIITPALSDERLEKLTKEIADFETTVFADNMGL